MTNLLERGRKQTNDVLSDLEQLLGRGRDEIERGRDRARERGTEAARRARSQVEDATGRARKEAVKQGDPLLARPTAPAGAVGIGPSFPITGLRRPDGGPGAGPADRPEPGRAAQGPRLRAPPRQPQDGAERVEEKLG